MNDIYEFSLKCFLAAATGMLMGVERKVKGKPAGLKTYSLVSLGACVFVLIALEFKGNGADMTRIIGHVAAGVGFLGAGTIIQAKDKNKVYGLASAATIWCSARILSAAGICYCDGYSD